MPFDFSELFTSGVREMLPRLEARRLAFAFDCRGPQLTLPGDAVAMRCSLHRLLCGLAELIEVGFLVFDAETGRTPSGEAAARVRLAGTGLAARDKTMSAVLRRLGLEDMPALASDAPGTRRARGRCPRTGAPIEFASLGKDGLLFSVEWVDGQAEHWELARPADAHGTPAWLVYDNVMAARSLARRLQRLGWAPRLFGSVAHFRRELLSCGDAALPALVITVESDSLAPSELEGLAHLLPPGTQCIHAVAAGSPTLTQAERIAGFDLKVRPLSPWELHQITERLCEQRRRPWRQSLPYPVVQEERPRLLVVDDNLLTRLMARSTGEALGYEVAAASDGEGALQSCERWSPDVVLMDVHMQPLDGLETTRRLRELQALGRIAPCAVVALTADDSEATRRACLAAGMDGHLAKPLMLPTLAAELHRVCAGHGRQAESRAGLAFATEWPVAAEPPPAAPLPGLQRPAAAPGVATNGSGACAA
ncbi:response regulator [Caldimonas tepidiphila]|uniref:response regulator n=1 Tax=Caldimonas tepidiphila TaxID=2315841 RepID=UPI000E5B9227|nr:response regulator [Caldimonas tepidiphila]